MALAPAILECGALSRAFLLLARRSGPERTGIVIGERRGDTVACHALVMVRNTLERPDRFEMDPWGVVVAHQAAWNLGLDAVAVFHTHPCGEPAPSLIDQRYMRLWPMPWIIASPRGARAWILRDDKPVEARIV